MQTSPVDEAGPRRLPRKRVIGSILAVLVVFGVLQIDVVQQNLDLWWRHITGREWHLRGHLHLDTFYSPTLGMQRQAYVYTPPGYDLPENRAREYPVLYLLHGSPDPGDGWLRYGRAAEEVDRLIVTKKIPPMLAVCPDGNGQGTFGDSEYIDAPAHRRNGAPGMRIATYIAKDVVDWMDSHFRAIPSPRARILCGVSTGGYGAINIGLQNPDLFATLFSFSGYYDADDSGWARPIWGRHPSPALLRAESPQLYIQQRRDPRWQSQFLFIGDGTHERGYYQRQTARFLEAAHQAGIPVDSMILPGRHSWTLWRELLRHALTTAAARLPDSPPPQTGDSSLNGPPKRHAYSAKH